MFLRARGIFQVTPLKDYVLVFFMLNSIEDNYSRLVSGERFTGSFSWNKLMVFVSFLPRIEI